MKLKHKHRPKRRKRQTNTPTAPVGVHVIKLKDAAEYLNVSPQTVARYITEGVGGIYLGHLMVGRNRKTTKEYCDQFIKDCTCLLR